jgi:exonuclease III
MRIATYNVNGINGRLTNLLGWLQEAAPDIVCLQELKAPDDKFPVTALRAAGYGAVWHGQKSWNGVAILARGAEPVETRRGLPGDPGDTHSRYIEAAIDGILWACVMPRSAASSSAFAINAREGVSSDVAGYSLQYFTAIRGIGDELNRSRDTPCVAWFAAGVSEPPPATIHAQGSAFSSSRHGVAIWRTNEGQPAMPANVCLVLPL